MFQLIMIGFGALLLLSSLLVVIAIWLNARSTEKGVFAEHRKAVGQIDPLFLRGSALFYWAKDTAAQIVANYLKATPTAATSIELSQNLHAEATRAMFPLGIEQDSDLVPMPCPKEGQGMIGITAPEVLEIADYIKRQLPTSEGQHVYNLAKENVTKLNHVTHSDFDGAQTPCPLQGSDSVCLVYAQRPLRCRPLHAATAWQQRDVKRSVNVESDCGIGENPLRRLPRSCRRVLFGRRVQKKDFRRVTGNSVSRGGNLSVNLVRCQGRQDPDATNSNPSL